MNILTISPFNDISKNELRDDLATLLKKHRLPGVSISILKDKHVIPLQSGNKNSESKKPVTTSTSFRIASISKTVFAYLVHKLVKTGIIDYDTPLNEYLPYDYANTPYINEVTTRNVLSHTTGFPNWCSNRPLEQLFKPGSKFNYSGEGFVFLQTVIEELTRKPMQTLLKERVFTPLGMKHSVGHIRYLTHGDYAEKHEDEGKIRRDGTFHIDEETRRRLPKGDVNVAGSMWSTALDYALFTENLLINELDILKLMTTWQIDVPAWGVSWGLGIGLQQTGLGKAMWQWGVNHGFKCFTITYLDYSYSITILTNGDNGVYVYPEILRVLTGELPSYIMRTHARGSQIYQSLWHRKGKKRGRFLWKGIHY